MATRIEKQQSKKIISPESFLLNEVGLIIEQSLFLEGEVELIGAKNAVLVGMASLLLTEGISRLENVPSSNDVLTMIQLLENLGAIISFDQELHVLEVDTTTVTSCKIDSAIMKKMRASVLVMGPLLARFCRAEVVLPGGCLIGTRPINFHLKNFQKMGVEFQQDGDRVTGVCKKLQSSKIVLEYPSVGATENILMAAVLTKGTTRIINAALEPEVMDLIVILRKMGAKIAIMPPAVIEIEGVDSLCPIEHAVMPDRLEAGSLITAAAITKGSVSLPDADANALEVFLEKLCEMGHSVTTGVDGKGITFKATKHPKAVSFITGPYPAFPTDLQAPMMAVQCLSEGVSLIHETVFENRFLHVRELEKMGAQIERKGDKVQVTGVETIYGTHVIASDIRASCALVIAGLAAQGSTVVTGVHHWQRGYHQLEDKLNRLGAAIALKKASSKIG